MARLPAFTALLLALAVGPALADNDCNDPVATWKTREQVRLLFEQNGRTVQRIKVVSNVVDFEHRTWRSSPERRLPYKLKLTIYNTDSADVTFSSDLGALREVVQEALTVHLWMEAYPTLEAVRAAKAAFVKVGTPHYRRRMGAFDAGNKAAHVKARRMVRDAYPLTHVHEALLRDWSEAA